MGGGCGGAEAGEIRAEAVEHGLAPVVEAAERAGLTRAGARRILLTLQTLGYVEQDGRTDTNLNLRDAFLAQAVYSGQSLDPLTDLWLETADVERLLAPLGPLPAANMVELMTELFVVALRNDKDLPTCG